MPESYRDLTDSSWAPVRVILAAARQHGPTVIKTLYDAMGTRIHPGGEEDYRKVIAESLDEVGLPADLIRFADSTEVDVELLVGGTPGFFEIKRSRTVGPIFAI